MMIDILILTLGDKINIVIFMEVGQAGPQPRQPSLNQRGKRPDPDPLFLHSSAAAAAGQQLPSGRCNKPFSEFFSQRQLSLCLSLAGRESRPRRGSR
jgi:hypothetical protein